MKLTGHKTEAVYRRYAIVVESDLRDAGSKLTAVLGTTPESGPLNSGDNSVAARKARRLNGWKKWWAGTGLNRRHQDFQSCLGIRSSTRGPDRESFQWLARAAIRAGTRAYRGEHGQSHGQSIRSDSAHE